MQVELLYVDGCPGYEELRPRLEQLLAERGLDPRLDLVQITSVEEAKAHRFLGSPSLRVDGHDVEPSADERGETGMQCRIYASADGIRRAPSDEQIVAALDRAR